MKRYLKVDYQKGMTSIYDTEKEVMRSCGFDYEEMTFKEFLEAVSIFHYSPKGEYDIIEIEGEIKFLNS